MFNAYVTVKDAPLVHRPILKIIQVKLVYIY